MEFVRFGVTSWLHEKKLKSDVLPTKLHRVQLTDIKQETGRWIFDTKSQHSRLKRFVVESREACYKQSQSNKYMADITTCMFGETDVKPISCAIQWELASLVLLLNSGNFLAIDSAFSYQYWQTVTVLTPIQGKWLNSAINKDQEV